MKPSLRLNHVSNGYFRYHSGTVRGRSGRGSQTIISVSETARESGRRSNAARHELVMFLAMVILVESSEGIHVEVPADSEGKHAVDLQSVARSGRRLWSMVGSVAIGFLFLALLRPRESGRSHSTDWHLFFNYPHYMATIYRAYHRAEDFTRYRIFTVHITALVVLTLLLSHFWWHAAVDLHHLFDLESMALQRAELRSVHAVCSPRWRYS